MGIFSGNQVKTGTTLVTELGNNDEGLDGQFERVVQDSAKKQRFSTTKHKSKEKHGEVTHCLKLSASAFGADDSSDDEAILASVWGKRVASARKGKGDDDEEETIDLGGDSASHDTPAKKARHSAGTKKAAAGK